MVWDANTDLLTYNTKYKSTIEFINAVNTHTVEFKTPESLREETNKVKTKIKKI